MSSAPHQVVIVGGGFGGLIAAKTLRAVPVEVTLLDRRNHHLFQPLLYQIATGGLSPANIAAPLRAVLSRQRNTRVLLATVTGFDPQEREVITTQGKYRYDTLIVAAGMRNFYFGKDHWAAIAPGLKSIEDATTIRRNVLLAFERAEASSDPLYRLACLTFVIIGGGPTGVEMAGAIGELAHHTLRRNFRSINPGKARIILVEMGERVLSAYAEKLSQKAVRGLQRLGISVRTSTRVTEIAEHQVTLQDGAHTERIPTETIIWTAGVRASPLGEALAKSCGAEVDRQGRMIVTENLTLQEHPEIFVIGDLAHCRSADGKPLPGVAPVAMQQGRYVGRCISDRLEGRPTPAFRYQDKGSLATIGRGDAIADLHGLKLWGYPAWLVWLFVHLMYIVGFENRLLVFFQWAWNYFTRNRTARLITHETNGEESACRPPGGSMGSSPVPNESSVPPSS